VIYLEGATVLVADSKEHSAELRGSGSVLVFDLRSARRTRDDWSGGRFSVLGPGDRWSRRMGAECTGSSAVAAVPPDLPLDALRASFARAPARFEVFADERTRTRDGAACADLRFDVSWDPGGS
jgi:hypothetical protein